MKYEIEQELMHRLYNVLSAYANEAMYERPRVGGVVEGCPRGPAPTPAKLVWPARWLLRQIEHDVLKRDAWDWIGKYEPIGPHCDTCGCGRKRSARVAGGKRPPARKERASRSTRR